MTYGESSGDPVWEQIIQDVQTALEAIVPPSYQTTVELVDRFEDNAYEVKKRPAILISPAVLTPSWDTNHITSYDMEMILRVLLDPGDDVEKNVGKLIADVIVALQGADNGQRGGLAIDTLTSGEAEYFTFVDRASVHGADLPITVRFRHLSADPTQAI